jgi:ribosomal protein S19E (S16A)
MRGRRAERKESKSGKTKWHGLRKEAVMKRTNVREEVRKMRFEEAYGGWNQGRLSQEEADGRIRSLILKVVA